MTAGKNSENKSPRYDEYLRMYMEMVSFAKEELKRREKSPVHIPREKIDREFAGHNGVLLVAPRIGFNSRVIRFWINGFPPGEEENQWKTMGHRHTVEAVIYVLKGHGYSIIEDKRYEWKKGDTLAIPVFSWHQHFNRGKEPARILVHTGGPAMENIGLMITQQGEVAEF